MLLAQLRAQSLPVRGARIEIDLLFCAPEGVRIAPSEGERGLKGEQPEAIVNLESLLVRGAWIEISQPMPVPHRLSHRSPWGERGLK